jgi:hypothetical protein
MSKMLEIVSSGKTVCFVSHNLQAVEHICKRVVWLHAGQMRMMGDTHEVLDQYMMAQRQKAVEEMEKAEAGGGKSFETGDIVVTKCEVIDEGTVPRKELGYGNRLIIRIHYATKTRVPHPYFMVFILGFRGDCLFQANMLSDGGQPDALDGEGWLDIDFGNPPLYPGSYMVKAQIRSNPTTEHFKNRTVGRFDVVASPEEYGYTGDFKTVYTYGQGIAQPYEYRWGQKTRVKDSDM